MVSRTPCPKSTSHNHRCHRVLRRSPAWDICSAMPASPPPTSTPSSRSTPTAAGCYRVFTETASGARADRLILEQVLDQLRPDDTLVVWMEARPPRPLPAPPGRHRYWAGRSRRWFRSLQEAIDTTTPGGKLVFHAFAALAEFERDLIRERTAPSWPRPGPRGRHGGRPSGMTAHKQRVAQGMYRSGSTPSRWADRAVASNRKPLPLSASPPPEEPAGRWRCS
jgi:hypothetical protein